MGGGCFDCGVGATNAVLNRHQLGIKLLFFGTAQRRPRPRLHLRLRLGSMTTFFCALLPFPPPSLSLYQK